MKSVRALIRYDIENLSEDTYKKALGTIFSEPPVDEVYEEEFPKNPGDLVFLSSTFRDSLTRELILPCSVSSC